MTYACAHTLHDNGDSGPWAEVKWLTHPKWVNSLGVVLYFLRKGMLYEADLQPLWGKLLILVLSQGN